MAEHILDLAILALTDRKGEPDIAALHAIDAGFDRAIADAVDGDPLPQPLQLVRPHAAVGTHPIAPQPAGRRQLEHASEPTVIGEEQQPLGVEVEPSDTDQARQPLGQRAEDGRPAARIGMRRHQPARLVVEKEPRALTPRQRLAIDGDAIGGGDVARGRGDPLAVDRHAPGGDPGLGLPARGETGARNHLRDPLAFARMIVVAAHCLIARLAAPRAA
jgi:hypothetical protein